MSDAVLNLEVNPYSAVLSDASLRRFTRILTAACVYLSLNADQSEDDKAPLLVAEAVGTFNVITGVVVLLTTVLVMSVPVVAIVRADTLVTEPLPVPVGEIATQLSVLSKTSALFLLLFHRIAPGPNSSWHESMVVLSGSTT